MNLNNILNKIRSYIELGNEESFDSLLIDIGNEFVTYLGLNKFVQGIEVLEVYEKNPSSRGLINKEGKICIFKSGVNESIGDLLEDVCGLSDLENVLCRLLMSIKTLLHEIEHSRQAMLMEKNNEQDLETFIIMLSEYEKHKDSFTYKFMYGVIPTERMAELQAYRTIIKLIEELEKIYNIELLTCIIKAEAIREEFYNYFKCGYDGPTMKFFEFLKNEKLDVLKQRLESQELSLDERVYYGFEITRQEYESLLNKFASYEIRKEEISNKNKL